MAFYDKFPYTNFQELNLDWLTQEVSKVRDNRDASDASAAAAQASEQAAAASAQASTESATAAAGSEAASAEYLEQIGTHTAGAVSDWLEENLQPTTPPIDATLTVSGAAADAKVTGDRISDLNNDLIGSGKLSFLKKAVDEHTIFPKQYNHRREKGIDIYTDKSGAVHLIGTSTEAILAFPLSENINTNSLNVHLKIYNIETVYPGSVRGTVGLYDGSTAYGATNFPLSGETVEWTASYSGDTKNIFVYLFIPLNTYVNAVISFATVKYDGKYLVAPETKMLSGNRIIKNDGTLAFVGDGDGNFIFDTKISYDRLWSMPFIFNFSVDNIDFDNGVVTFADNAAISPSGYFLITNQIVNYTVDNFIKYFVYNKITGEITVHSGTYDGTDILLFGIYYKKLICPYTHPYDTNNIFQMPLMISKVTTIYIDTTAQTITFNNCLPLAGFNYYNMGDVVVNFTYKNSYAHFVYMDKGTIKVLACTATNATRYTSLQKEGIVPLFYFYNGEVYGIDPKVIVYYNGAKINGRYSTLDYQLADKKMAFLGDSITEGVGAGGNSGAYPKWIADKLGCTCLNHGLSGSAITVTSGQSVSGFIARVPDIPTDCDVVAFMGGTNDYWQNVPLGQDGDTTDATFYGALNVLVNALQERFPTAFIYAVIPPMGWQPDNNFDMSTKSNIGSFEDVATAIRTVCRKYAVPVIDFMHDSSLNPRVPGTKTEYFSDGVHLNVKGEKTLASAHIGFLRSHYRMTW